MYLNKRLNFTKTTVFRLTSWYLLMFGSLSLLVFGTLYFVLATYLHTQTDTELRDTAKEFKTLYADQGIIALQAEFTREAASKGTGRVFFTLRTDSGAKLASSDLSPWQEFSNAVKPVITLPSHTTLNFITQPVNNHLYPVRIVSTRAAKGHVLTIGTSLQSDQTMLAQYREIFFIALMLMLFFGGYIGWRLAYKSMEGIVNITKIASHIGRNDLSQRVALTNNSEEINALTNAFNLMLERISLLVDELQQMTDNVAHELRSPITRIRGMAEITLQNHENIEEYQEMAAMVVGSCDEVSEIINTILEIAKNGSGIAELTFEPLLLGELVVDAIDLFAPIAADKNVSLRYTSEAKNVMINGDRARLQRVIANLLDNAIKFTPTVGCIEVSLHQENSTIQLKIKDTGIGIEQQYLPFIFNRFFRVDQSRAAAGNGLGLSLVAAIIQAHNATISVHSDSTGSCFTLCFPVLKQ